MNYQSVFRNTRNLLSLLLCSIILSSSAAAVGFNDRIDLSFFDEPQSKTIPKSVSISTNTVKQTRTTNLQQAVQAYTNGHYSKAYKIFNTLAQHGNINAQYSLGTMYFKGLGVDKNMIQAFKWHTRAARNGHTNAQLWLHTQLKKKSL
ncbi:hypothetical protein MNBD_GAMMA12-825 [hydrothermal vent metagenome]|uniref:TETRATRICOPEPTIDE REPEAT FAMILY PROTEIN n=1 Tax=hydrothermal vent metagenome TaxID=652676 RepID=A0A3B0YI46_9ZZZZ